MNELKEQIDFKTKKSRLICENGDGAIISVICYPKLGKIITGTTLGYVSAFDVESNSLDRLYKHQKAVWCVLVWNENVFLSCGFDGSVEMFSVDPLEHVKNLYKRSVDTRFCNMLKLNEESLLVSVSSNRYSFSSENSDSEGETPSLFIINYSSGKLDSHLSCSMPKIINIGLGCRLKLSKLHENSFYVNGSFFRTPERSNKHPTVKLINFKKDIVEKSFDLIPYGNDSSNLHDLFESDCNTFELHRNERNEEILIACSEFCIYIFNSHTEEKLDRIDLNNSFISIMSSTLISNRYFIFGGNCKLQEDGSVSSNTNRGGIKIIDIKQEFIEIDSQNLHHFNILSMKVFGGIRDNNDTVRLVTVCRDGWLKIHQIKGLDLKNEYFLGEEDLKERILYLKEVFSEVDFLKKCNGLEKEMLIGLNVQGRFNVCIYRSIFV